MAAEYAERGVQVAKVACDASNENKKCRFEEPVAVTVPST
jgi:hypothetical protein